MRMRQRATPARQWLGRASVSQPTVVHPPARTAAFRRLFPVDYTIGATTTDSQPASPDFILTGSRSRSVAFGNSWRQEWERASEPLRQTQEQMPTHRRLGGTRHGINSFRQILRL